MSKKINIASILDGLSEKTSSNYNSVDKKAVTSSFAGGLDKFDELITDIYTDSVTPEMKYFNEQLFRHFNPDINGYTLIFMVPPAFALIDQNYNEFIWNFSKLVAFAATDFSPPQIQVQSESISSRSGGVPYATEVLPSEQCSVTYIDNQDLDIYRFHYIWIEFIKQLIEGFIPVWGDHEDPFVYNGQLTSSRDIPGKEYLQYTYNGLNDTYGALDYAASIYSVKYNPTMKEIQHIGKATGIYPQSLPTKELIGQRTANEITTLPFTYFCAYYEEAMDPSHPIWQELVQFLNLYNY